MGYEIRGVISRGAVAQTVAEQFGPGTRAVELEQGFALVPYTGKAQDHVPGERGAKLSPFWRLDSLVAELLAQVSRAGPLAYVEADFFGGVGEQRAAVWEAGALVWGPTGIEPQQATPPEGTPISQALRRIGVTRADPVWDEFDALGLRRYRHTDDWLRDLIDEDE